MTDPTTPPRPVTEARDAPLARRISHTGYCVVDSPNGRPTADTCSCGYARDLDNLIALARDDLAARVAALEEALNELTAYPFSFDNWGCRDCQQETGHSPRCRVGKAIRALTESPTPAPVERVEFAGQDWWPCGCGHVKREHYFGDEPAQDGGYGAWCQMDPAHCYAFTPTTRGPR